jgi:hypothetical protein
MKLAFQTYARNVVKYVSCISEYTTPCQKNNTKNLVVINPCLISALISNSVTRVVDAFLDKVRNDSSFTDVRNNVGSGNRIMHL